MNKENIRNVFFLLTDKLKSFQNYSYVVILIVVLIVLNEGIGYKRYNRNRIVVDDVVSYYAYLPAAVVYHDLSFQFKKDLPIGFTGKIWTLKLPDGRQVLKMSMGVAILILPFFFLAHLIALVTSLPADGYSAIYQFSVLTAAVFYLLAGLLFLRKALLRFFNDRVIAIVVIAVVLGTNLFNYSAAEPGMSHVYSFFLFNGFLYFMLQWFEMPSWKNSFLFALFTGMIVLIRPVNVLILVLPLLYRNGKGFRGYLNWLWEQRMKILFMAFWAFLVLLPQMIYWKYSTGHWVFYSYLDERFYFNHPHIIDGLFSYRKGWFVYTPLMLFFVGGIYLLRKRIPELFLPLLVFLIIDIYVIFSWWSWWYGGSFGARPMIESYGLLAFPFAVLVEKVMRQKIRIKIPAVILLAFLIYLNLFQSSQYRITMIHWAGMSKQVYWKIFLTKKWPENYEKLLVLPDDDKASRGEDED